MHGHSAASRACRSGARSSPACPRRADRLVRETCRDNSRFIDAGSAVLAGERMRAELELPIQDMIEAVHGDHPLAHPPAQTASLGRRLSMIRKTRPAGGVRLCSLLIETLLCQLSRASLRPSKAVRREVLMRRRDVIAAAWPVTVGAQPAHPSLSDIRSGKPCERGRHGSLDFLRWRTNGWKP